MKPAPTITYHRGPTGTVHGFTPDGVSLCKRVRLGPPDQWPIVGKPWDECGHCYMARFRNGWVR